MKYRIITLLFLAVLVSCQKAKEEEEPTPGGGGSVASGINLAEIATAGNSASQITYLQTNRKGNMFLVSINDGSGKISTYAGDGKKWEKLGDFTPASAAISETGTIVYFQGQSLLKRYSGSGTPETITIPGTNNYPRVIAGHDGKMYVSSFDSKVYSAGEDGKTWTATDIPISRFVYNGQLPIAFFAYPGKLYTYSPTSFATSVDAGKSWQTNSHTPTFANSGYVDRYAPVSQDLNGLVYIRGGSGVTVLDMQKGTSKSISFQSAGLDVNFERLENFTSDDQGNVYGSINTYGYDYEFKKTGGSIYKYSGSSWQKFQGPGILTGFNGMPLYYTEAGIISAANGLNSKGLYSISASGQLTAVGAPETSENIILSIAPHSNGKVFAIMRHSGGNYLNPGYASLMMFENGQWKATGLASDQAFVTSGGEIYSIHDLEVSHSKDGGNSWQKGNLVVEDPQNLRNFLSLTALHLIELKGELHLYSQMSFGGVGGVYANFGWTKAAIGTTQFDKITPRPGSYNPGIKQVPLVTGNKGMTGFIFKPFNGFAYLPSVKEEVVFTKDGGVSYTAAQFPLPFAGSNSGSFVAWGANGFSVSTAANPLAFTATSLKIGGGEIDMQYFYGANYFTAWARFSTDNKLYIAYKNKVYGSDKSF